MKTVMTVAGSDSGGGAGIQADLKTFSALEVYGTTVITAVTAQNTTAVTGLLPVPAEFVALQMETVLTDIPPQAIKIGMLANRSVISAVAGKLVKYPHIPVVLDTVLAATTGADLLQMDANETLVQTLFPRVTLITPNLAEAETLAGFPVRDTEAMKKAALSLHRLGAPNVLVKGGHLAGAAVDILFHNGQFTSYVKPRITARDCHGTGCTYSSAIAAYLARGLALPDAVAQAKEYITNAIAHGLVLGQGRGPTHHFYQYY